MEIMQWIRRYLAIPQERMAMLLGVNLTAIKQAETGRRRLPTQVGYRVAELYDDLQARARRVENPEPPAMDPTWQRRQIRSLEARLKHLDNALEDWNDKLLYAKRQAYVAEWLSDKPPVNEPELERMGRERLAFDARMQLGNPPNQIDYWETQLKRVSILAQLELLQKNRTL